MTRTALTAYASGIGILSALWTNAFEALPLAFAFCGITFAISAGLLLFKE